MVVIHKGISNFYNSYTFFKEPTEPIFLLNEKSYNYLL